MKNRQQHVCSKNYGGIDIMSLTPGSEGKYNIPTDFTPTEKGVIKELTLMTILQPFEVPELADPVYESRKIQYLRVNNICRHLIFSAVENLLESRYPGEYICGIRRTQ